LSKKLGYKEDKTYNKKPLLKLLEDRTFVLEIKQVIYTRMSIKDLVLADKIRDVYTNNPIARLLFYYFKKSNKGILLYKERIYLPQNIRKRFIYK